MKRLLVFHPALAPYRIDFFNRLDAASDATFYFTRQQMIEQRFDDDALRDQTTFTSHFFDQVYRRGNKEYARGYSRAIRESQPDVLLGSELSMTTWRPLIHKYWRLATAWLTGKPVPKVWSIVDDSLDMACRWMGGARWQRKLLLPLLDGMITVNPEVADYYESTYALKRKPVVMPIIQEDTHFRVKLESALPIAAQYIQDYDLADTRCLLFVGRLVPLKGVDRLITAFCASEPTPKDRLIIVGEGESAETLKAQAAASPYASQILFVGRYEDLNLLAWYLIGQTLALCSDSEAFGAVVNEALLAGMPVLCTEVAGAASLLGPTQGAAFPYMDTNRLAELIKQYLYTQETISSPLTVRPSLMPVTFEACMQRVLDAIL